MIKVKISTLKGPTFVRLVNLSVFPMSKHSFSNVKPFNSCIVITQANLTGNCRLSCEELYNTDLLVSEIKVTHLGFRRKTGPVYVFSNYIIIVGAS